MLAILCTCPFCGSNHSVLVRADDYQRWQEGELAQNAFPYLSVSERELLISGICSICQESIFGGDEDDDDEDYEDYEPSDLEVGFDPYEGCYSYDC